MLTPLPPVRVGDLEIGAGAGPFALIAGPCVIEDRALVLEVAAAMAEICAGLGVPWIFKASFDKANRSALTSFRGPGLAAGLEALAEVKQAVGAPVTTDIHLPEQAAPAAEVVDLLQVPAFLCRQTDLLAACAATGRPVNVKKGQFLAPWDMKNVVDKLRGLDAAGVMLTERGASFGYNTLVTDMRALVQLRELGVPVCFDATHSVQQPGGLGAASGGERRFAPVLARAAAAVGVDAIFMEVHPDPDRGLSDGPNMIPLAEVEGLLKTLVALDRIARGA
jgi:2-dehydro-3-deoxyphosphooctonate aldolase (KDO 8-P synthase)